MNASIAALAVSLAAGQAAPAAPPGTSPAALAAALDATPGDAQLSADYREAVRARVTALTGGDPARLEAAEAFPPAAFSYLELTGGLGPTRVSRGGDAPHLRTALAMVRHAALLAGAAEAEVYRDPAGQLVFEVESGSPGADGAVTHRVTLSGQGAVILREGATARVFVAGAPFNLRPGAEHPAAPAAPAAALAAQPAAKAPATAPGPPPRAPVGKGGFRLGYFRPMVYLGAGGDFRGESVLVGPEWAIGLPRFDDASDGFGLEFGGAPPEGGFMGIRYQRTRHPAPTLGPGSTATLSAWWLDFKGCTPSTLRVQACLEFGLLPYSHLDITNDAVDASGKLGTAHFRDAFGVVLGAGAQAFLTSRVSIQAGASWQIIDYSKGAGFGDEPVELEESVTLHALTVHLGVAVDL